MKHRIPIIALALLVTSCLAAEPTTQPATQPAGKQPFVPPDPRILDLAVLGDFDLPASAAENHLLIHALMARIHRFDREAKKPTGVTSPLNKALYEMDKMRAGDKTPFEKVEKRADELSKKFTDPGELGRIYAKVADVYGQSGNKPRTIHWVSKALKYPLDPTLRLRMYMYWGDCIYIRDARDIRAGSPPARQRVALPYLLGIREALQYRLPATKPELPRIDPFDADPPDPELTLKHRKQIQARVIAVFLREMVFNRDILVRQLCWQQFKDKSSQTRLANALKRPATVENLLALATAKKDPARFIRAMESLAHVQPATKPAVSQVSYEEAFADLYEILGREYPCFDLKKIDWKAVGKELLPQAKQVKTDEQFGLLCMRLVARLEDSHAHLRQGKGKPPSPPFPRWDPGLACLIDDRGKPVVYYIDKDGPAEKAGVKIGMTVISLNGKPAEQVIKDFMNRQSMYWGYSSQRYLKYHAGRFFIRQMKKGDAVTLEMQEPNGRIRTFKLPATLGVRYLRRLPVPIKGISDSANVSWTMLDNDIGYIYVRRIRRSLIESLDRAVAELKDAQGLIIDVRGNSGGGFDARRAHRNFALNDNEEPKRPRFKKPMAMLTDSRCISAGEGWASWFIARKRAKVFGAATAGASSRKRTYTLKNGLYKVTFPVKAYRGFLDRPIERRGLEPDVKVRQNAKDLAAGRDTVLQAARKYLLSAVPSAPAVDPAVMAILKRLEAAGEKYPNITAHIDYKVDMLQTGDTESRTGKVYYQGPGEKEPAKFRIHFDTLRQGTGPKIKDVVDYAFDGAWLTVRKERIKQVSRYQVARPGEKVNPLQLGKGPFPVPFGQKADTVIKHFRPTTRASKKTDPKDTDYIKLTTRRRYRKEFSVVWLEMWIDRKTSLPVKIVAEDRSENQTTVIFKDTKTPKSFDKKIFTLPRPPAGWEYHVERFKGQVKP